MNLQDDIVMGTLTVRENLMFSASLRLPPEFSKEDRRARVEMVINDLGLSKVADSKVCTIFVFHLDISSFDSRRELGQLGVIAKLGTLLFISMPRSLQNSFGFAALSLSKVFAVINPNCAVTKRKLYSNRLSLRQSLRFYRAE